MHFKARSVKALADATLQANLRKFQSTGFTALRAKAVAEFGAQLFEALRGEGAAIRVGPGGEQHRRMKEVLHAVQHDRLLGAVGERDDRLQPQQIVAAHRCQRIEPAGQRAP